MNENLKQPAPLMELRGITKRFPGVTALSDVSLSIHTGEVLALVGENGAGKSTLMNILYGLNTPTSGKVFVKGQEITHFSPSSAIASGVGMVHQHFMLVPSFTVAQNIVLSNEPRRHKLFYDFKKAVSITEELVMEYGLQVNPNDTVAEISVCLIASGHFKS